MQPNILYTLVSQLSQLHHITEHHNTHHHNIHHSSVHHDTIVTLENPEHTQFWGNYGVVSSRAFDTVHKCHSTITGVGKHIGIHCNIESFISIGCDCWPELLVTQNGYPTPQNTTEHHKLCCTYIVWSGSTSVYTSSAHPSKMVSYHCHVLATP